MNVSVRLRWTHFGTVYIHLISCFHTFRTTTQMITVSYGYSDYEYNRYKNKRERKSNCTRNFYIRPNKNTEQQVYCLNAYFISSFTLFACKHILTHTALVLFTLSIKGTIGWRFGSYINIQKEKQHFALKLYTTICIYIQQKKSLNEMVRHNTGHKYIHSAHSLSVSIYGSDVKCEIKFLFARWTVNTEHLCFCILMRCTALFVSVLEKRNEKRRLFSFVVAKRIITMHSQVEKEKIYWICLSRPNDSILGSILSGTNVLLDDSLFENTFFFLILFSFVRLIRWNTYQFDDKHAIHVIVTSQITTSVWRFHY